MTRRRQTMVCPCCEGTGEVDRPESPATVGLTPRQLQIYNMVKASKQAGLGGWQIVHRLWDFDEHGGPEYPLDVVHVTIRNMNMRLAAAGETVAASRRGPGATYTWKKNVV